ncbi:carboxypeptidase M32 [Megalodesulfovibrio gigas]|uniref:Metal-dependent carboxypeptidase n=1 Tax=Megalodesulfovibrio gigas (strain ATCC 19364 / DSM 1382 / NCIMB 9332 / VKM B-1759) TaxID=1121448 RepID=T2GA14_MEGG1|nr:carboxypeptidase M32 [Megalodesulfovibrio gigas]AGW13440.1 putative Carboxypeptidase Taq [Megalodesulfovibrio gigas DSM 1382 = ATCC 19364]
MPADSASALQWLYEHSRETARFYSALELLAWDQRTMLAPAGHDWRGEQVAALMGLVQSRLQDPARGERLTQLETAADLSPEDEAAVFHWRREYHRAVRVPLDLVRAKVIATSKAEMVWQEARPANAWPVLQPLLEEVVRLKKEEAACLADSGQPLYDVLLDEFEPGETTARLEPLFDALAAGLRPILDAILGSPRRMSERPLQGAYPVPAQQQLNRNLCEALGFSFESGRLDVSAHPFSCAPGPRDHRITTRHCESNFLESLYGVLHEAGHSLYMIGLPEAHWGTPLGSYISLGVHESQSRLWENMVGRSLGFCRWLTPLAKDSLPCLSGLTPDKLWRSVNMVSPSLIRTEADEVTYCLHVILRFRLETALMDGRLEVKDLPEAWDAGMEALLGIRPDCPANGVMQDMHWPAGAIGYFPTYALGTMYAAQLYAAATADLGGEHAMDARMAAGEFSPLLTWLRERVHCHGMRYMPQELIRQATGQEPSPRFLLEHLARRHQDVHGI